MTSQEKIQKMFVGQAILIGVEFRVSGEFVYFTNPTQSKKYQDIGRVRISDRKVMPYNTSKTPTSRHLDAVKVLEMAANALNEIFPTVDAVEEKPWESMFL